MDLNVGKELVALNRLSVDGLRARYSFEVECIDERHQEEEEES